MRTCFLLAFIAICAVAPSASADFQLRFQTTASVIGGVAQFSSNSVNTVSLYLDATTTTDIAALQSGLITANIGDPVAFSPGVKLTGVGTIEAATPNSLFDNATTGGAVDSTKTLAAWTASVDYLSPAVTGSPTSFGYSVLLGTFDVKAGNFGESGVLTLSAPILGDLTLGDLAGTNVFPGGATFNFTAVPEPSTFVLMGMGLCGAGLWRRRNRSTEKPVVNDR